MSYKVDDKTRVVSVTDREKYLEMKAKRALVKRVSVLENAVEHLTREIEALKASRES